MSEKRPQSTAVLIKRMRRVAKWLDSMGAICAGPDRPQWSARANTCWQGAARLEDMSPVAREDAEHVKDVLFEAAARTIARDAGPR